MEERILLAGRQQLREVGAAALSVRAIARQVGVASSAVYRYVSSRDELLTVLIVDAFTDLADCVDAALLEARPHPREQFEALAQAMHSWALDNREQWTLLYGSPVPGYSAPTELTTGPGTRVMGALLNIAAAGSAHELRRKSDASLADFFSQTRTELGSTASDAQIAAAAFAWSALAGAISAEVFGHLGPLQDNAAAGLFANTVAQTAAALGFPQDGR